jgi:hypothetical protein
VRSVRFQGVHAHARASRACVEAEIETLGPWPRRLYSISPRVGKPPIASLSRRYAAVTGVTQRAAVLGRSARRRSFTSSPVASNVVRRHHLKEVGAIRMPRTDSGYSSTLMRTLAGSLGMRSGSSKLVAVGGLGCLLAITLGASAATSHGLAVAAVVVGLTFCAGVVALYLRDPVLALLWLWIFEVFNAPLSASFGYFSSTGELIRQGISALVLLFAGLTVWRTLRSNVSPRYLQFLLPGVGVAVCGTVGAALHGVPVTVTLVGAWLGLKLWVLIGVSLLLPWKVDDLKRIYTALICVGVLVALVGILDYAVHGAVTRALHTNTFATGEGGYRANAVQSILSNPGEYSLFMSLLFALALARVAVTRAMPDLLIALLFAGSVILSLRLKGVLSVAAVVLTIALFQTIESNRGGIVILVVGALLFGIVYGVEKTVIAKQVSTYTSSEATARARLYSTGGRIADDNFPVGVGFGRFASYPSRKYYSPVYQQYGLNRIYGLSREYPKYIDDVSWPSVIGETGYGGLALYVLGLLVVIAAMVRRLRSTVARLKWAPLGALCAMAVMLVDSLGDPTLFSWLATTTYALIVGPTLIALRPEPREPRDRTPDRSRRRSAAGSS